LGDCRFTDGAWESRQYTALLWRESMILFNN
jgi:hypothetical protein